MNKTITKNTSATSKNASTSNTSGYTISPLKAEHMQSAAELFIRTFCDDEPITKHLGIPI